MIYRLMVPVLDQSTAIDITNFARSVVETEHAINNAITKLKSESSNNYRWGSDTLGLSNLY